MKKTCNECAFYAVPYEKKEEYKYVDDTGGVMTSERVVHYPGECRLNPVAIGKHPSYWCGQWKEKEEEYSDE